MITLSNIQKEFGATLRKRNVMCKWIEVPECQKYIKKALRHLLTKSDYDKLYTIGNWKGQYPGLNYLCTIYIHPLTYVQGVCEKNNFIFN